jgi:hypothetical protein
MNTPRRSSGTSTFDCLYVLSGHILTAIFAPMSTLNVFGFFALAAGKRVAAHVAGATYPIHHNHYVTSLKTTSDDSETYPSATLRVYSGAGDAPLPDNTITFIVAKAFAPTGKPVELDVLYMYTIPGDPNDDEYEVRLSSLALTYVSVPSLQDGVPDCPVFAYGVSHLPANHTPQVLTDGSKTFTLSVTEYVNGAVKSSDLESVIHVCVKSILTFIFQMHVPGNQTLANVPLPCALSCTQFLGQCNGFSDSTLLQITLGHVTLSLGPHSLPQPPTNPSTSSPGTTMTPVERKKYLTIGSTPTTAQSINTLVVEPSSNPTLQ